MSEDWKALRPSWQVDPEAALVEARRRVAVCAENNDVALYLGDLALDVLPEGISDLTWLHELRMFGGRVTNFLPLAPLSNLELLQIGSLKCPFPGLDFMPGWTRLQALEIITPSAVDLRPAASCAMLKRLSVFCNPDRVDLLNLEALRGLEAVEHLALNGMQSEGFDVIGQWARLKFVQLVRTNLTTLAGFENLHRLEALNIWEAPVSDLSPIADLSVLEELRFNDTPVSDISSLVSLPLLRSLDVSNTQVSDLSPLQRLAECQREFNRIKRQADPFWHRVGLETLEIYNSGVSDLAPLSHLDGLQDIDLHDTAASSLDPLRECKSLRRVNIAGTAVTDLGPRGSFAHLQYLAASGTRLESLQALGPGSSLQALDITNTRIADLTPIRDAFECRALHLRGSEVADLSTIIDTGSRQGDHRYSQETLDFRDTPASRADARLAELAALANESPQKCFFETKRYLQEIAKSRSRPHPRGY